MDLSTYDASQATHGLRCSHSIGRSKRHYTMPCLILSKTKAGMLRIVVFGERDWKYKGHKKRIRYVQPWRLFELKAAEAAGELK